MVNDDAKFMDPTSIWHMLPCLAKKSKPSLQQHTYSWIDILPDQLLMEILCRLPNCKAAVQCKSVCKRWAALLSQPYFITHFVTYKVSCGFIHIDTDSSSPESNLDEQQLLGVVMQHHKLHPQVRLLMHIKHPLSNLKGFSFGSLPCIGGEGDTMPINVVGAFDDLLLCHKEISDGQKHELFLCNVQTRQWQVLPSPPLVSSKNHFGFLCEPYYYSERGIDNISIVPNAIHRYNIAILPHKYKLKTPFTEFTVLIYSSETSRWRESLLSLPKPATLKIANTCGFAFNGMIHIRSLKYIIGFDPNNNGDVIQCHLIKWPSNEAITRATLAVCQGCLQASRISDYGRLDIWLLEDYNTGTWSLQHSLLMKDFLPRPLSLAKYLKHTMKIWVLGFHPSRPHLLYIYICGRIVLCDVHKRLLETVSKIPSDFKKLFFRWDTLFWVTLPLWPTPLQPCVV